MPAQANTAALTNISISASSFTRKQRHIISVLFVSLVGKKYIQIKLIFTFLFFLTKLEKKTDDTVVSSLAEKKMKTIVKNLIHDQPSVIYCKMQIIKYSKKMHHNVHGYKISDDGT